MKILSQEPPRKSKYHQQNFCPSGKSLIQTKNNKGPKIELRGTPALICGHFEVWPFRKTLYVFLFI